MAMNEYVARSILILPVMEGASEIQDRFDMLGRGHDLTRYGADDVVKTKRRAEVITVGRESGKLSAVGIDDRKNVGYLA